MDVRPGVWKLYKSKGAAAFSLLTPLYDERGYMSKHGGILLEVAPGVGRQQWDWDSKITFALSIADICNLIDSDPQKRRIFHQHNDNPKVLEFRQGKDQHAGTYMMGLSQGKGDSRRTLSVPFSNGEYQVLIRLLVQTIPLLLGWTDNVVETQVKRRLSRANS